MDEELKPEFETSAEVNIATQESVETKEQSTLSDLPRIEDLIKSEKEVKTAPKIEGVTDIESQTKTENRIFAKKEDKKKVYLKKRVKIATGVYVAVATLLLAFVGVNLFTLTMLDKDLSKTTNTITTQQQLLNNELKNYTPPTDATGAPIEISLNPPRDYQDDNKELTFLDKLTIIFRSLFA